MATILTIHLRADVHIVVFFRVEKWQWCTWKNWDEERLNAARETCLYTCCCVIDIAPLDIRTSGKMDVRAWLNVLRTKKKNGEYQKKWKRTPAPFLKVERFSTENPQSDHERYRLFENNKKDASAQDKKKNPMWTRVLHYGHFGSSFLICCFSSWHILMVFDRLSNITSNWTIQAKSRNQEKRALVAAQYL